MHKFFLQDVSLTHIRHNDLACYVAEGFGGKSIEKWPIYKFFSQYVNGDEKVAVQSYVDWYINQLNKYHNTPKQEGGMHRGSLFNLIEARCGTPFALVAEPCKREAIYERVMQRFQLLEVIRERGYKPEMAERIDAVRKNGSVYLCGGHHRAAILRVLGGEKLPGVLVFPNQLTYNLFCFLRNIKYGNFQK